MSGFTHLHLHSQYSLLDGAIRLNDLCSILKERGMNTVAITDHGNMYGAVHFYQTAKKYGIKPIMGCEVYVAYGKGRKDRSVRSALHLVLLAKDNEGYKNLTFLVSMGFTEGFYYHPRIDKELLRKHAKGLYGLSACLGGVISRIYFNQGLDAAIAEAREFAEIFAPGHFFLELQENGFTKQPQLNEALKEISAKLKLPLVATADAHYLSPSDAKAHEVLMCIQQNKSLAEFRQKHEHPDQNFVKTPQQMWDAFSKICQEAVENTIKISNDCNVELTFGETYLPNYGVPSGRTLESYLEEVANQGLQTRIKEMRETVDLDFYQQRLDYELNVIIKMGFAGYFLIVWDFIQHAKSKGVPVGPGRGSGAGSLVAYALRITDLDPIHHDLIFERFLNPDRVSMPDFDIDFCQDRRGEVIDYVLHKYGKNNVGQIVTYSQLSAKSVIKDVGRVMEVPFAEMNELTKLIPNGLVEGKKVTINKALEIEPKLRELQETQEVYKNIIDIAKSLEGLNRQTGMHAAGIVIGDKPLWEYVPVCSGKNNELITQFAKDEVELAGLVKFDFLGLKTLTVIANAVKHVRRRAGSGPLGIHNEFDIDKIPIDDAKVFELIASADTDGVFQLESSGFKELLKRLRPDRFEDIVAAVALYRPGPLDAGMVDDYIARKHGKKKVIYPHQSCAEILEPTYGVIVYQEQVMRIAVALSGFTMGEADTLRKAMGKKKADVMAKMHDKFVRGAECKSGMTSKAADELFTQIEKFAGYAFNKSHSAAYALVSYQTAYLKTYYPVEFMAALLSTEMNVQDNVVKYIQSAKARGIAVLPPDVNRAERDFTVVTVSHDKSENQIDTNRQAILFGLGAVKGVGGAAIESIVEKRGDKPFRSIYDFAERVDSRKINRKVMEALIKSGSMDCLGKPRWQLFGAMDKAIEIGQTAQRDREVGQASLFTLFSTNNNIESNVAAKNLHIINETYPATDEWSDKQRLLFEKEALGFYITGHPLERYTGDLKRLATSSTIDLTNNIDNKAQRFAEVSVVGIATTIRERPLKDGSGRMAFVILEDLHGSIEVLVFSKVFNEYEAVLKSGDPLFICGTLQFETNGNIASAGDEDDTPSVVKLRATRIELLADARSKHAKQLELHVPVYAVTNEKLIQLKEILVAHKGDIPARLTITEPKVFQTEITLPETLRVNPSDELLVRVDKLFGEPVVRLS
ncbi:MAG: DNA polymerase III subunit alpha [Deltaproteobacteria bacterium]|nr:DNA polymerase III subunit alpha [Deltaproteobacteria bacterium]